MGRSRGNIVGRDTEGGLARLVLCGQGAFCIPISASFLTCDNNGSRWERREKKGGGATPDSPLITDSAIIRHKMGIRTRHWLLKLLCNERGCRWVRETLNSSQR